MPAGYTVDSCTFGLAGIATGTLDEVVCECMALSLQNKKKKEGCKKKNYSDYCKGDVLTLTSFISKGFKVDTKLTFSRMAGNSRTEASFSGTDDDVTTSGEVADEEEDGDKEKISCD